MLKYTQAAGRNIKGENKPFLNDCLLIVKTTGISISSIEEKEALIVDVKYKIEKKDIKKSGKIPMELEQCIKSLKRYASGDEISVNYSSGMIKFTRAKPKLELKFPTIDESNVKSVMEIDFPFIFKNNIWIGRNSGVELSSYVKLDASEFKEIVLDGEQIQYRSFPFVVSEKQVVVTVEDSDSGSQIVRELKIDEIKTEQSINSLYSYGFGNTFGNLTGKIEIWLGNELPMIIKKESDGLELIYMLATTELEETGESDDEGVEEISPEEADNVNDDIEEELAATLEKGEDQDG